MRSFIRSYSLLALILFSLRGVAAGEAPSLSGTTIPSATQIVDMYSNVWTLSDGRAYENGKATPSSGVILLLCYGGTVYQENIHHNWWLWDSDTAVLSWVASSDPRVISPSGTTLPSATQIIDSELNVWTLSGGKVYEKGHLTPSDGVILLLYAKGVVYQENIHKNWWAFRNGAWAAVAAPPLPSASGTAIPAAARLVDSDLNIWTVSGGKAYENHQLTPSSGVSLLLFYHGSIYQEKVHDDWWRWNGSAWITTASDPRTGHPFAYVGSCSPCNPDQPIAFSVTVIDTGTNRVAATIPMEFDAAYMVVAPDAKHVYVAGFPNSATAYGAVAVIDTELRRVVTTIPLQDGPEGIAASPDGKKIFVLAYPLLTNKAIIYVVDTATNTVESTINLPAGNFVASALAISPDGQRLYVSGNPLSSAGYGPGLIYVIDTTGASLVSRFSLPPYEFFNIAVSPDNSKLYVNANQLSVPPPFGYAIAVLDPVTGHLLAKISGVMTVGLFSPDAQHLYGTGLGSTVVIDTATEVPTTAVANLNVYGSTGYLTPFDLAITPDGKYLYIVVTNSVVVADTATYTVEKVLPVSTSGPIAIVSVH